jgi:hypothetical protein
MVVELIKCLMPQVDKAADELHISECEVGPYRNFIDNTLLAAETGVGVSQS